MNIVVESKKVDTNVVLNENRGHLESKVEKVLQNTSFEAYDSTLWKCLNITPYNGGSLYHFAFKYKLGEKTDDELVEIAVNEIFPAVEVAALSAEFKKEDPFSLFFNATESKQTLERLGYSARLEGEAIKITLPDVVALTAGWEKCRLENEQLPPLQFVSSEGIATDEEFVRAFYKFDGLISNKNEIVHDQTIHIMSILNEAIQKADLYAADCMQAKKLISSYTYEPLLWAKANSLEFPYDEMMAICSLFADIFSGERLSGLDYATLDTRKEMLLMAPNWDRYFKKRFSKGFSEVMDTFSKMQTYYRLHKLGLPAAHIFSLDFDKKRLEPFLRNSYGELTEEEKKEQKNHVIDEIKRAIVLEFTDAFRTWATKKRMDVSEFVSYLELPHDLTNISKTNIFPQLYLRHDNYHRAPHQKQVLVEALALYYGTQLGLEEQTIQALIKKKAVFIKGVGVLQEISIEEVRLLAVEFQEATLDEGKKKAFLQQISSV